MSSFLHQWSRRLHLNHAYGQLIALVLFPLMLLFIVAAWGMFYETQQNYIKQQQYIAETILKRYQFILEKTPYQHETDAEQLLDSFQQQHILIEILQELMVEQDIKTVNLISPHQHFFVGKQIPRTYLKPYQQVTSSTEVIGPIHYNDHHLYAISLTLVDQPSWLWLELDNQPILLAQYRIGLILIVTGFLTLIMLMLILYLYSRHWLSPLYEIRLQLQRLTGENLSEFKMIKSSGELTLLQRDVQGLIRRLNQEFNELKHYAQETEEDSRRMLDQVEIQSANYHQQLKKVMNLNQSKSIFLANISHELRTPLNSIEGFIQLLLRQQNLNHDQRLYLETIRKSSAHLLALINDVLDYSKIEAGKLQLDCIQFNLEDAIFDVIDMLSPLASQKHLNLVFYYPQHLPIYVWGDELRFKQILTNLVSNAIKFTPEGEVIVRVKREHDDLTECVLHFSVQDSGIGVNGADKQHLFESFSQADTSITRQYGGTGLGLAISKQLVQLMHGNIGFYDNQVHLPTEKGSTFWFTARFRYEPQIDQQSFDLSQYHVLSYLEHPATASALRYYLEQYHIQHDETNSVFNILNQLHTDTISDQYWVILDYNSDIEGLLKEVRKRYHGHLAVYGYQMALNMALLNEYQVYPLYQPLNRKALIHCLTQQTALTNVYDDVFDGQHLHVLAVDDHLPNLMVLEALLQEFNIQLTKALSGHEALQRIQQRIEEKQPLFDLVFMDIQMPIMSGIDTTRAIRSLESTLNIAQPMPIIALSAHILTDEKQKILECGMNDHVSKPIHLEQLVHILQKWAKKSFHAPSHTEKLTPYTTIDTQILDWQMSLNLAANKPDLALELLQLLVKDFNKDCNEIQELIDLEDFPQLEQILHRIYGATRYVGTPSLQHITGEFEQFVSTLRKEQRKADDVFAQAIIQRFQTLQQTMTDVKHAVELLILQHTKNEESPSKFN